VVADATKLQAKDRLAGVPRVSADFRGSWSGYERDDFFLNPDGLSSRFYKCPYVFGLDFEDDGRAAVPTDVDGDGDLDLILHSLQGLRLIENRLPVRSFARVRLVARTSEASALGAVIELTAGGVTQRAFVTSAEGFESQMPRERHFGLGSCAAIERLRVRWPSGAVQEWGAAPAGKLLILTEGDKEARIEDVPRWPEASRPVPDPGFQLQAELRSLDGGTRQLRTGDKPLVLNFWAPSCAECVEELPALGRLAGRLTLQADFVGILLDTDAQDEAKSMAAAAGAGFPQLIADDAVIRDFFGDSSRVIVPSTFVFDASGTLLRVFRRAVSEEEIGSLLPGSHAPPGAHLLQLRAEKLMEKGNYAEALPLLDQAILSEPGRTACRFWRGVARYSLNRIRESIEDFAIVVASTPEDVLARINYSTALMAASRPSEALAQLNAAAVLPENRADVLVRLGLAFCNHEQGGPAESAFDRAIQANPGHVGARKQKGKLLVALRRYPAAVEALEAARQLTPGDEEVHRLLAEARKGAGR
jgi:tetratricopeptide (TPR) repeat protein